MNNYSPDFSLEVEGVRGFCPAGEQYAQHMYTDIFLMDDVPEAERNAVARRVADAIIDILKRVALTARRGVQPAAKAGAL